MPWYVRTGDMIKIAVCSNEIFMHQNKIERPCITIWVHGTKLFTRLLHYFSFCPPGLTLAKDLPKKYHHRTIADTLIKADENFCSHDTFYLFGWSGKLSFTARKRAAQELYDSLCTLITEYQEKYNQRPYIRIITHSHGGNVALNLASIVQESDFYIDELILLACPVQEKTKEYSNSPIFKKVISLFSTLDKIQILDPQGIYINYEKNNEKEKTKKAKLPLFSKRVFPCTPQLTQAQLKIHGRGLLHLEFLFPKFLRLLPGLLSTLDTTIESNGFQEKPYYMVIK